MLDLKLIQLALGLFVLWVFANNTKDATTLEHLALGANSFYGRSYFHEK